MLRKGAADDDLLGGSFLPSTGLTHAPNRPASSSPPSGVKTAVARLPERLRNGVHLIGQPLLSQADRNAWAGKTRVQACTAGSESCKKVSFRPIGLACKEPECKPF